jgi:C_GCAxxG_C_C family probable redox protein
MKGGSMLEKVRAMSAKEKQDLLNEIQEAARYNEAEYGSTVRCILYTLHKYLGLYDDERVKGAIKAGAAFPGGIAGNTEVCGGMIAGVMAISLVYGPEPQDELDCIIPDTPAYKPKSGQMYRSNRERAAEFITRFRNEFGSVECKDIHTKIWGKTYDLRNPDDYSYFMKRPQHDR